MTSELPESDPLATTVNGHVSSLERFFASLMENLVQVSGSGRYLEERVSGFAGLTQDSFTAASEGNSLNGEFQMKLENLKAGMLRTIGAVNRLTGLLDSVKSLTEIIDESAESLHLISINTAIAAARAGDRGFGVIATELRALARREGESVCEVDVL